MPTKPDLAVIHEVPTGRLIPHPENARRGDVPAIARSLAALGQYRPLVVSWRTGHVCAGNHTLAAAISLGWDTIKVGYVTATPTEERRILLADNRLPELGHYDDELLATLLALVPDPIDVGYTDAEMGALLAAVTAPVSAFGGITGEQPEWTQISTTVRAHDAAGIHEAIAAAAPPDVDVSPGQRRGLGLARIAAHYLATPR